MRDQRDKLKQELDALIKQLDAFNQYKPDCRLCRHYEQNRRRCLNVAKCKDGELFAPTDTVMLYGSKE